MPKLRDAELRRADEELLTEVAKSDSSLGVPEDPACFISKHLKKIGIAHQPPLLGNGYLKLKYGDFIVEEIAANDRLVSILPIEEGIQEPDSIEKITVRADLVKQRYSTQEALELVAEKLGASKDKILYAGLKDETAVTAQTISIDGFTPEQVAEVKIPDIFLKNIHRSGEPLKIGRLTGNRFTIHIRCAELNPYVLHARLKEIEEQGMPNFYSLQRFGSRLQNHLVGRAILQQRYEQAMRLILTGDSPHETGYIRQLRKEASQVWGNWKAMQDIFQKLPFFLNQEILFLDALMANSGNFAEALASNPEEVRFLINSYMSYAFNLLVSHLQREGSLRDEELPLPRNHPPIIELYKKVIPSEEWNSLRFYHPKLPFLLFYKSIMVRTIVFPKIHGVARTGQGYAFFFDLPKGAYATTFFSQIFDVFQGRPVPGWVDQGEADIRPLFEMPPLRQTESRFGM